MVLFSVNAAFLRYMQGLNSLGVIRPSYQTVGSGPFSLFRRRRLVHRFTQEERVPVAQLWDAVAVEGTILTTVYGVQYAV